MPEDPGNPGSPVLGGEVELSLACDFPAEKRGYYDENLVLEVLENLLSNAIRYAESSIVIELDTEKRGGKEYLYLYVEDDGPGFSGDGLREALEPLLGTGKQRRTFRPGASYMQDLCQLHGGAFSIANQSGGRALSLGFLRDIKVLFLSFGIFYRNIGRK